MSGTIVLENKIVLLTVVFFIRKRLSSIREFDCVNTLWQIIDNKTFI